MKYTIGIDFGTLSGRAVLAETATGRVIDSQEYMYPHGVIEEGLPQGWALQHPKDYLEVLEATIPQLLHTTGVVKEDVIAIGVDFTASTTLPVDEAGVPLCFYEEFAKEPHAYVKLWKHHSAQNQATRMTALAEERKEPWLALYGGKVCCEWSMPKLLELLEEAPHIYETMAHWVEAGDWIVWQLTGQLCQSACGAGYKAFWRRNFPSGDFFKALDPRMEKVAEEKLSAPVIPVCAPAGRLMPEMARKLGLAEGTIVAASMVDAHACFPAAGVTEPGDVLAILGTSGCYMALFGEFLPIPGITGAVEDGILPGYWGYEAGQSCLGDHFAWAAKRITPERYQQEARSRGISAQQYLTELAQKRKPGESGLVALDWWNGNRSILMDAELTGMILGMTLSTRPEDIYRALIEATAYGARTILDNYQNHGLPCKALYATGGICQKNPMMMQIYADVMNIPVHVVATNQGGALGSAIIAATAAGSALGGYDTAEAAIKAMAPGYDRTYLPQTEAAAVYEKHYRIYAQMHEYFGVQNPQIMHSLLEMKA